MADNGKVGKSSARRRVLIVEDDRERAEVLKRRFRSAVVRAARNYADSVKALGAQRFDLVLLDHDLDDGARNGQDIAAFIATRLGRRRRPACVLVHSTNPAGSYGIYTTLKRAGFAVELRPFPNIGRMPRGPAPTRPAPSSRATWSPHRPA